MISAMWLGFVKNKQKTQNKETKDVQLLLDLVPNNFIGLLLS